MSSKIRDSHSLRQRWKPFLLFLFFFFFFLPTVSSVSVVVDSDHAEAEKRPPQFANEDEAGVQPTQIILDERERLNLKCPLKSNASYIQWTKDGQQLQDETAMFLDLPAVSRIDSGLYRCYAENDFGALYSWQINVTVTYLDGFATDTLSIVTVPELGNFILKPPALRASSSVNLSWRWFYQDNEITSDSNYYITLSGSLVVGRPQSLAGNYTVQVKATNGPMFYHNFLVETDGDPRKIADFKMLYSPRDLTYVHGRAHSFSLHSRETQTLSEIPVFECVPSVVTKNPPTIRWFLNGDRLVSGTNGVHIENRGRRLILMNAKEHFAEDVHVATVSCRATNSINEVVATAKLDMIVVPKIDRRFFGDERLVPLGSAMRLKCKTADSWPRAKFTWLFNGKKIPNTMSTDVLKIDAIEAQNYGVYQCEASNSAGADISSIWVKQAVEEQNDNDSFLAQNDGGDNQPSEEESPIKLIEYGPSNQSVLIGTNIKMPCKISDEALSRSSGGLKPEWFRNGQRISKEDDPQRRLSIDPDGSLSITQVGPDSIGTYKCLVKLGKDVEAVEASIQIIERPAMPQNVEAFVNLSMNPAKIRVSWQPGFDGNSPLINHIIEMRTLAGANNELASEWTTVVKDIPPELCCAVFIDNLKPSATAEFRVIAVNRFGQGRPSIPSPNITMPQQPPAAAPRDVKGSGRSSSSIIVQWQPPPADLWNGDILGYTVRYRLAGYPTLPWIEKNVTLTGPMHHHIGPPGIPSAKNVLIDQLISWRDYEIQVAAFNDLGPGVFSKSIEVAPLESPPMQAPQNVQVEVLNSTDIRVSFDPLDQQMIPGVNLGYKIELWKGPTGSQLYKLVRVFPDYSRLHLQIGDLEKFGRYNLTVLCFTAPGDGPRSEAIEFQTEEDVPGPVSGITFDQVLYSSVLVEWEPPAEKNGNIIKYILRHWESNKQTDKSVIEVSGDQTNATIEGLRASTQYSISIQALTQVGAGPSFEAQFESGVPPELPGRPSSVVVSDIGARSAVLQFIPGFDGHSYIKNWIVEAKIGSSSVFSTLFTMSAPKARSFTVERLRPNTKYQLRLIAENIRGRGTPSDPTRSFETRQTEPEGAPEKLYAEPLSDDRIQVVWSPLNAHAWNGDPLGYLIMYRPAVTRRLGSPTKHSDEKEKVDVVDWKEIRTSSPKASELTLLGLAPYTSYQIKIYAENTFGRSRASEIVSATTYESTPAEGPPNVRAQIEQQSLRVQWDDLPSKHKHGQILGFRVRCETEEEALRKYSQVADLVGPDVRSAHFTNLRPYTDYRCFVHARTVVGEGPASKDAPMIRTGESRPSAPTLVRFNKVSDSSLNLLWSQPSQPNGRITGYEIRYRRFDQPEAQAITTAVRPTLNEFSANSLTPNTTYVFSIRAETRAGWGPEGEAPVFTSVQRAITLPLPQAPQPNPRHAPSARSIWIKWPEQLKRNEPLTSRSVPTRAVEVEFQRANDPNWTSLNYSIGIGQNEIQIDGLLPNQPYRARIRYVTDSDRTRWSPESEWIKTLEVEPESPPQDLQARPYESSSILLEWQALNPLKWNSDRVGYRVLYRIYQSNDSFMVDELPMSDTNPEGGKIQHVIRRLASFHHYIVQVQAYNSLGSSAASTPPSFVYVGYSIPKQEIKDVQLVTATSTSLHLKWGDWQTSEDDVISGYRIKYIPLLSSMAEEFKEEDGGETLEESVVSEKNEVHLTDLRKYTEYQVSVSGYNRAGDGKTTTVRLWTLEDTPGPIGSLHFSDILLDSVNVSWSPPLQPNGKIVGYSVTYRTYRQPDEFRKEIQEKTTTNWLLASRLDEQTTYSFSVQALTSVGAGAEIASNVTTGYNPGAPESPTKPIILPEETSLLMRWQNGAEGHSPIKGHLIQAKRIGIVTDQNKTLMIDDDVMDEGDRGGEEMKPLKNPPRRRRHLPPFSDAYSPRHPIGEWITLTHLLGGSGQTDYRLSYRQLEPASFYVFRVYARNDLGVSKASAESDKLQVPATLPNDPFFTKWWFLVIVGLIIMMVIIVFVATLCVTSANAWKKEHEKQKKQNAYDIHQLPDDFVVSYELQSKQNRLDDHNTTPRPGTHTSWLSNEGISNGRLNHRADGDPAYGSIGSGLNTGRSIYGSSSVYQALATDQIPNDGAQRQPAYASRRPFNSNGVQQTPSNYWAYKREDGDYIPYGEEGGRRAPHLNDDILNRSSNQDQVDAELQAEHSFASHYQSTNPLDDIYRRTWRRTREEARHTNNFGAYPVGLATNNACSRPESASTNESPVNGSDAGGAGSASTQSAKSMNMAQSAGIQLRNSNDFDSPKHVSYAPVAHGYSSFV